MQRAFIFILTLSIVVSLPLARPFKSPVIDGNIIGDGSDWDRDDLAVDDPLLDSAWGPNDIDDLWATYDAENLYIGVRYQVNDNAMMVLIDAGTGIGASNINGLDWYPRNFNFPDSLLGELIIANWNGGALGVHRITGETTSEDITSECQASNGPKGNFFFEAEVKIPWNSIYQLGPGLVNPNARVKVVTLIAGGDNWNGPDSAPDNPGMNGAGTPTTLSNLFNKVVDGDGDGLPDGFVGAIEGTVSYEDPLDDQTVATVRALDQDSGALVAEIETAPGGGAYLADRLPDGTYEVEVTARGYGKLSRPDLVVSEQGTLSDVDFFMLKTGKISGEVVFRDGPGATATVSAYDSITGEPTGDETIEIPPTGGSYEILAPDGTYYVVAEAVGYLPDTVRAVIESSDSVGVDTLGLYGVRATHLVLIDDADDEIPSINTTVSFPDSNIYFYASAQIEARDDLGRRDYFNIDGHLEQVNLEAYKLNNTTPPRGNVVFFDTDTVQTSSIALDEGRGRFLITDDEIEVLRVFTRTEEGDITGRFKVGIRSTEPEFIEMTAFADTITADGIEEVAIEARLLDISRNPVRIADVPVSFVFAPSSTGKGTFRIPSAVTSAEGEVATSLVATRTGKLHVAASATYLNKDLVVLGEDANDYIEIVTIPGAPASIRLSSESDVVGLQQQMLVFAQLLDDNGNAVPTAGYTVNFSHSPASTGGLDPISGALDATGRTSTTFTAGTERSVVQVNATSTPSLPVENVTFLIDKILFFSDPEAPEPDPGPHSFSAMDLTAVTVGNDPEGLDISVKFSSTWDGAHLVLILETSNDPDGAGGDPFGFPISYAHSLKPELALTYKYSADDYADLRRWDGSEWLWWDSEGLEYRTEAQGWVEGVNVRPAWVVKDTASVNYKIPFSIFEGNVPDTVRVQVYLMQEADEEKRSAFDSAPSDATLNLDFDPLDPEAPWDMTVTPVELQNYSPPYVVNQDFPNPPNLSSPTASPATISGGETVNFTVEVTSGGAGIGNVMMDLSPLGGPRFQLMRDDGSNGDALAGDGIFSHLYLADPDISGGEYNLAITAKDADNVSRRDTVVTLTVEGASMVIRSFADELGDDHGPDQFGFDGLYYLYPTNSVFVQRAFDLEEVTIFETSKIVAGEIVPSLAFQVRVGNVPDPADEGTADWNPKYADINIQKVDIYVDAFRGGATEGLPNRQNDFAKWDAWDYVIVMEGWYKGVVASDNQNTPQAWAATARKTDTDIILVSDFVQNTITAVVSKEALGDPSQEEILGWDLTVLMTSHDGNSDDNNFGDTRWVSSSVSEWQPGGGSDSDRDPNILDFMASPGLNKKPGRSQIELLNYKSEEAVARSENGETAVVLEASAFEDQGAPVINVGSVVDETVPFVALINAPLYYTVVITDDDLVSDAIFRWRPDSTSTGDWMGVLDMGYAGNDLWSVDLPVDEITAQVPLADFDDTRNIEFMIEAIDPTGNVATSPLYTMEIPLPASTFEVDSLDLSADVLIRAPEGTSVWIPTSAIPKDLRDQPFDFKLSTHQSSELGLPPEPARSINVFRTIELSPAVDFMDAVEVAFHYPQYEFRGNDENYLAVFEYNYLTQTWIYVGGNVNRFGNLVTVNVKRTGTYGIFFDPSASYQSGEVFSGVTFSPNPFSPNGDGLYEETNVSFFLSKDATVTIEIYDMEGNRMRILQRRFPISAEDSPDNQPGRITGMTWDGRDNVGKIVPYGIYVARFTVDFTQAAGQRTIRINRAVAVIK